MKRSLEHMPVLVLCIALSLLALNTQVASAHAELQSSIPAADATVSTAPERVTLIFTEELESDGNTISVKDAAGTVVDNGDTTVDRSDPNRATLVVTLKSGLTAGPYTVSWKNNGADGHSEEGSFRFTIGSGTTSTPPAALPSTGGEMIGMTEFVSALILLGAAALVRRRSTR